jgi:alpha-methylacyl-CoA racemase
VRDGSAGPLSGIRVLEIASAAPGPFACMIFADLGAEVLRVDRGDPRDDAAGRRPADPLMRSRRSVVADLKQPGASDLVKDLVRSADVLAEGFRPGVMERLGLGPDDLRAVNPRLVYARMTGWGQAGPLAGRAGHDINYIAVAGALEPMGRYGERPMVPLNLVGDFGGGGMLLAVGVLAALVERNHSGLGQVVDAAIVDGAALLTSFIHGVRAEGDWSDERGTNLLDGGAPFYDTYETAEGQYVAVGALERRFYDNLVAQLGLDDADLPARLDRSQWDELRSRFAVAFKSRNRDEWASIFDGVDACVSPVLSLSEVASSPYATARSGFVDVNGHLQPAPAPRFSRTPAAVPRPTRVPGEDTEAALRDWGISEQRVRALLDSGVVSASPGTQCTSA